MSEWVVQTQSMVPQGQLAEVLVIARVDRPGGTVEVMRAKMEAVSRDGVYDSPDPDSPLVALGVASIGEHNSIDALLQAIMDCAWQRGLRPKKFDPSAGELAAVKAHLDDMRKLAHMTLATSLAPGSLSDIDPDPNKSW